MEDEKTLEGFKEFRKKILKVGQHERAKVRNSIGVYDIYKKIRKNKWYDIGRPLKEHEFYSIIRGVNNLLAVEIGNGNTITLPSRMGCLELRKMQRGAYMKDGKLRISYPVDWDATLRLWFTDKEAKEKKTLIRMEENFVYRVKYNKHDANYENESFYEFDLNPKIGKMLKENIKAGKVDTMFEDKGYSI